jgi:hypothetical protein
VPRGPAGRASAKGGGPRGAFPGPRWISPQAGEGPDLEHRGVGREAESVQRTPGGEASVAHW